ncbi:MAG: transketolase [Caldilineaceae bacterium]|nr:transketolase [Caldilineaceae bacterium]
MRTAFINELCEVAAENERVWLLCADIGYSVLERFADRFPDRFVNVGVAEQNMTGIAAGLAMSGKIVFTYSIANFPTLRCLEQIRSDVCYHNANVKVVSVGGGLAYGPQGYTHHGLEDLAIMRSLPNMKVVAPADPVEAQLATRAVATLAGPAYLRLGKANEPVVHSDLPSFETGKVVKVQDGERVLIVSTGGMLKTVLDVGKQLENQGVKAAIWSSPWLKPFDEAAIRTALSRFSLIVTVENAQESGGLGSCVAEVIAESESGGTRLIRAGVPDTILKRAYSQEAGRSMLGLDAASLSQRVLALLESAPDGVMSNVGQ